MKTICLYFEIHQIVHLKRYRFFDIGADHYYYDDYENERSIADIVDRSYMPALNTIGEMIKEHGDYFKVAFSLSGVGMEQLELHAPKVLDKLQELNQTGCVEFLAEPYSHGLSSLKDEQVFRDEVKLQAEKIKEYFGQEPKIFRNSGLIYKDEIGEVVADMGFKGLLTEGAQHVLGWKSPHYLYHCALNPNLKLLLRDYTLSDDIALRFSNSDWEEYPLFADNYIDKIAKLPEEEQLVNIFMNLSAIGISQPLSSGILEFLRALQQLPHDVHQAVERGRGKGHLLLALRCLFQLYEHPGRLPQSRAPALPGVDRGRRAQLPPHDHPQPKRRNRTEGQRGFAPAGPRRKTRVGEQ